MKTNILGGVTLEYEEDTVEEHRLHTVEIASENLDFSCHPHIDRPDGPLAWVRSLLMV